MQKSQIYLPVLVTVRLVRDQVGADISEKKNIKILEKRKMNVSFHFILSHFGGNFASIQLDETTKIRPILAHHAGDGEDLQISRRISLIVGESANGFA